MQEPNGKSFSEVMDQTLREKKLNQKVQGYAERQKGFPPPAAPPVLNYRRVDPNLPALHREDTRNAGYDLFARVDEDGVFIHPGKTARIPLNVATDIPLLGVGLLFQRSSTFSKWGVKLTNNVGVIDASFAGNDDEWNAEFRNETDKPILIPYGAKICQAVFLQTMAVVLQEKEELFGDNRGGFGTSFDYAADLNESTTN